MFSDIEFPSMKSLFSSAASMTGTIIFLRTIAKDIIPPGLEYYLSDMFSRFMAALSSTTTVIIDEYEELSKNGLFSAAQVYISSIASPSTRRFRVSLPEKEKTIHVTVGKNEEIIDVFRGFHLKWQMVTKKDTHWSFHYQNGNGSHMLESEIRYFHLTFHKKHKNRVIDEYLPYVLEKAKAVEEGKKTLKLYTLEPDTFHRRTNPWQSVNLDHPSNFKTLAMDEEITKSVMDDLNRFLKRKELYRKVGKAWKRGYLLFGPPGTGKSSLIAAIANHLHFDVYDLELSDIKSNSDLRRLLISTENRSILVVEDIDASIDLSKRETHKKDDPDKAKDSKVTLSGVLNFIDGLWSSCGDERIIIFTTNHQEKLDPALLRPGRMDVHIPMSFCTPCGLRILASNYHGINEHRLLPEAEKLIDSTKVTPAEVAEQLLKEEDPETAIHGLIQFLQQKNGKNTENNNNVEGNEIPVITKVTTAGLRSFVDTVNKWILPDEAANAMKILALRVEEEEGETESLIEPDASLESSAGKENEIISGTGMVEKITLSDEEMNAIKILIRVHEEDANRARERLLNQLGITAGDQDNVKITN